MAYMLLELSLRRCQYVSNTNSLNRYLLANHARLDVGQDRQYRQCLLSPINTRPQKLFHNDVVYIFTHHYATVTAIKLRASMAGSLCHPALIQLSVQNQGTKLQQQNKPGNICFINEIYTY